MSSYKEKMTCERCNNVCCYTAPYLASSEVMRARLLGMDIVAIPTQEFKDSYFIVPVSDDGACPMLVDGMCSIPTDRFNYCIRKCALQETPLEILSQVGVTNKVRKANRNSAVLELVSVDTLNKLDVPIDISYRRSTSPSVVNIIKEWDYGLHKC